MKHNSREHIIRHAAALFNKRGNSGTSLAAICEATSMSKGSIYANFKDKDELAIAAFSHQYAVINQKLEDILGLKDDPHEQLMLLLDYYENAHKTPAFTYGCPLVNAATEADDTFPALKMVVNQCFEADLLRLRKLIKKGIKLNLYKKKADPDFAFILQTTLHGALLLAHSTGETRYMQLSCDHLRNHLNGWLVKSPSAA